MRVIGTAGHVDHGKSTLVQALTGTHPDRLKEEREREMTIDLGFAWLTLEGVGEVGVVDVPGHRDFIENMLAGVGGIDAVLFVVAADEGVMPQTREHLAILDLLQIQGGVVALTKTDLIEDADWLTLVEDDLAQAFAGTVLENAPMVRVSARARTGIPALKKALADCLAERPPRPDLGRPRLPVDRVFTIAGFGTIVTGTLLDGRLKVGDEVEILPSALRGRVRGLQTHKRKEEAALPGGRTAVNIAGLDVDQVARGEVVVHPGDYEPTRRLDVRFRLLADAAHPLAHSDEVKFFTGAAETTARVRLLGSEQLIPGESGWLQLELSHAVTARRGDRYILRRPSPGETLGGGVVMDVNPPGRHKRFDQAVLARLEALLQGTPAEVLAQALQSLGAAPLQEVIARSSLEAAAAQQALAELWESGQIIGLESGDAPRPPDLVISLAHWNQLSERLLDEIEAYHQAYPLRLGIGREELKSRVKLAPRVFNAALRRLAGEGAVEESGAFVRRAGHAIRFNAAQQKRVEALLARFAAAPAAPPTVKDCQAEVGEDLFNALLDLGQLALVSPEVVFRQADYEAMTGAVRAWIKAHGTITAAEARDHFNTSRRYVLALLEHLDAIGVTVREGDARRLKQPKG